MSFSISGPPLGFCQVSRVIRAKEKLNPLITVEGIICHPPTHQIRDDKTITLMMPILHFLIRSRFWKLINHIRLNTPVTMLGVRSPPPPSFLLKFVFRKRAGRCYVTIAAIHNLRSFRNSRIFLNLQHIRKAAHSCAELLPISLKKHLMRLFLYLLFQGLDHEIEFKHFDKNGNL